MSENQVQCKTCGRNGYPPTECKTCLGQADVEPREYTLSEIQSGRAPKNDRRYGPEGAVGPKIVRVPGSGGPGESF